MTKKIIRCKKCANRLPKNTVGFIKSDELHCVEFDISVDKDDGCTFGEEGDPKYKMVRNIEIDISNHSTVYGFDEGESNDW